MTTLLTIPETAARIGCHRDHVYTLISRGQLDTVDIASATSTRTKMRVTEESILRIDKRRKAAA